MFSPFKKFQRDFSGSQISFFILLILTALFNGGRETAGLALYQIVSLLLFYQTLEGDRFRRTPVDYHLLIFLIVCGLSTVHSLITQSRGLIHFSTILIHIFNFYALIGLNNKKFRESFSHLVIALCLVVSIGVLIHNALSIPGHFLLPNANLLAALLNFGIIFGFCKLSFTAEDAKCNQVASEAVLARGSVPRASGEPKVRPLASKTSFKTLAPALYVLALVLMIVAYLNLSSRGALISLSFGMLTLLAVRWRKFAFPMALLVIVVLTTSLFFPRFIHTLITKSAAGHDPTRALVWKTALNSFIQKPFTGWGMGSFGQVYQLNKPPMEWEIGQYEKTTRFSHNEFLDIAVETGIFGLISFLALLFSMIRAGFSVIRNQQEDDWMIFASLTAVIVVLIHSLFDFNLHLPLIAFLFVFSLSLLIEKKIAAPYIENQNSTKGTLISVAFKIMMICWILVDLTALSAHCLAKIAEHKKANNLKPSALFFYKLSVNLNPFNSENLKELAFLSEIEEREFYLKMALRFHKKDDSLHAHLARTFLTSLRHDEAVISYQKAIESNPKFPFHYSELAEIFIQKKLLENAASLYLIAIETEPFYAFAHYRLGEIYLAGKDKKNALKAFQNVLKIKDSRLNPSSDYSRRLLDFDYSLAKKQIEKIGKLK